MKINIAAILKNEGAALDFKDSVDVGTLTYLGDSFRFAGPVSVEGVVRNIGGTLEITGSLKGAYSSRCDCCGAPVEGFLNEEIDERFESDFADADDELFRLNGTTLDMSGLVNTLVWGGLPMKLLCRDDCKGLCPVCGANLNETVCNCDTQIYDPRLAIIREQ